MTLASRSVYGDWQTPAGLADDVLTWVARHGLPGLGFADESAAVPAAVLEPTCGRGVFLAAAGRHFPSAQLLGYDINPAYVVEAGGVPRAQVQVADFFAHDWRQTMARLPEPLLVLGNPPWVTSAALGSLGSANRPRARPTHMRGLDAVTGKSNFDVSEWMLVRLLEALQGRHAVLAMLCKATVARKVLATLSRGPLVAAAVGFVRINAAEHFRAAVDAGLFVCSTGQRAGDLRCPVYADWAATTALAVWQGQDGRVIADAEGFARTRRLGRSGRPLGQTWRSGLKHDCAPVMELLAEGQVWVNGLGERVVVEDQAIFPLLKGVDLRAERTAPVRAVVLPAAVWPFEAATAQPALMRASLYLEQHRARFDARKSVIYKKRGAFAVFGLGPYTFAPWKVAVAGMHKRLAFWLIAPHQGRPVLLDDTCYFLPFWSAEEARTTVALLNAPQTQEFFEARIFWNDKRPITKALLDELDWEGLAGATGSAPSRPG